jgi:hypothetical protein
VRWGGACDTAASRQADSEQTQLLRLRRMEHRHVHNAIHFLRLAVMALIFSLRKTRAIE